MITPYEAGIYSFFLKTHVQSLWTSTVSRSYTRRLPDALAQVGHDFCLILTEPFRFGLIHNLRNQNSNCGMEWKPLFEHSISFGTHNLVTRILKRNKMSIFTKRKKYSAYLNVTAIAIFIHFLKLKLICTLRVKYTNRYTIK